LFNSILKILVIDDNQDNLTTMQAVLSDAFPHCRIFSVLNGEKGIELAIDQYPDVVLLDMVMPGMDGFEVCRNIKNNSRIRHIPVVFITAAKTDQESRIKALEAGAEAFLFKPLDEAELIAQIRAMAKIKAASDRERQEKDRLDALVAKRTAEIAGELEERRKIEKELLEANQKLRQIQTATLNLMEDLKNENTARRNSDEALTAANDRLALAQTSAGAGMWDWDMTSGQVNWSLQLFHLFGLDPLKVTAAFDVWKSIIHPDDRQLAGERIDQAIQDRIPLFNEYRIILPTGEIRWINAFGNTMYNEHGKAERMSGICIDITERKRAIDALYESEQKFRTITEQMNEVVYVTDKKGIITYVSPSVRKIFGYTEAEMLGHYFAEFLLETQIPLAVTAFTDAITRGKPTQYLELEMKRKDSTEFTGELSGTLYFQDEIAGIIGLIRDISERKRNEEEIRESRARLELALQSARMGIWTFKIVENKRHFDNQTCRLLGIDPATFTGAPDEFFNVLHPDDRDTVKAALAGTINQDTPYEPKYRVVLPDGSIRHIAARGRIIRDENGQPLRITGIVWDETEHKHAEEKIRQLNIELEQRVHERTYQLEAANKELEAFAYTISHDLRAPLRAIDGFTHILLDDFEEHIDKDGKHASFAIRDNIRKMGQLIDDLLAFSRLGRAEIKFVDINMQDVVKLIFDELTTPGSRARIDFITASIPPATGDPTLIRQVWTNLLANAIKFSAKRERPIIQVNGEYRDGEILYSVKDNGAGFSMKYITKLFNVFQRLHHMNEFEGTGVGLAIVHRIVSRHGGRVWAEGEVDKGAAFYFTLPQKKPENKVS
jgi:PAS domain S-box-containing protein